MSASDNEVFTAMLAAVTGFVAMLPSVLEPDKVGMISGAVYDEVGSVPSNGGNNWIQGLTVSLDADVDDDKVTAGFSRSQFAALTIIHCYQHQHQQIAELTLLLSQ